MTASSPAVGSVGWMDLTVPDAAATRGSNADIPPQWLMYIVVAIVAYGAPPPPPAA